MTTASMVFKKYANSIIKHSITEFFIQRYEIHTISDELIERIKNYFYERYLSGIDAKTDEYIGNNIDCCIMCKRFVVNSGIKTVIMRISKNDYKEVDVNEWLIL